MGGVGAVGPAAAGGLAPGALLLILFGRTTGRPTGSDDGACKLGRVTKGCDALPAAGAGLTGANEGRVGPEDKIWGPPGPDAERGDSGSGDGAGADGADGAGGDGPGAGAGLLLSEARIGGGLMGMGGRLTCW